VNAPSSPGPLGRALAATRALLATHAFLAACVGVTVLRQIWMTSLLDGALVVRFNALLSFLGLSLALCAPLFTLRAGARRWALLAADLLLGLLCLVDLVYLRQFGDLPTVDQLRFAGQTTEVASGLVTLLRPWDLLLFPGAGLLALLRPAAAAAAPRLRWRSALGLVAAGLLMVGAVVATSRVMRNIFWERVMVAGRLGPLGFHAYDATMAGLRTVLRRAASPAAAVDRARQVLEARTDRPGDPAAPAAPRRWNVIVVQAESLQDFTLGLRPDGAPLMPSLEALAAESTRVRGYCSQVGQGNTSDAEFASLCSLYPLRQGSAYYTYAGEDLHCLPEVLRDAGWATLAFHGNRPGFWNREAIYPSIGFQAFHHLGTFPGRPTAPVQDDALFDRTLEVLERTPEPFFAFVITMTAHFPFANPTVPARLATGARAGSYTGHYLDHQRVADRHLGAFVERLRARGLLDRTILAVYGDHQGVGRGNSDLASWVEVAPGDRSRWFDLERGIPFVLRVPGRAPAELRRASGQVDLAPTLLRLLGLSAPNVFLGRDLLDGGPGFAAMPSGAVVTDQVLYLPADGAGNGAVCLLRPAGTRAPEGACAEARARAASEMAAGWNLLESSAVELAAGRLGPATAPAARPAGATPSVSGGPAAASP